MTDLLVFGKRAGDAAGAYALDHQAPLQVDEGEVERAIDDLLAPLSRSDGENPYQLQGELQDICTQYAPIIRDEQGLRTGLSKVLELSERAQRCGTGGANGRAFNPGWHTAKDLRNMLVNAEALFRSALERRESRGAHARSDYPDLDPEFEKVNIVVERSEDGMQCFPVEHDPIPEDMLAIINKKYERYIPEELR